MSKYAIITTVHNSIKHTVNCVESVLAHSKDFEMVIVNNGSTDGTTNYLREIAEKHGNFHIIENKENKTFAAGNNQGIEFVKKNFSSVEYIIFLNNDTVVTPNWISRMEGHFDNVPIKNIGMVGPVSSMSNGHQMVGRQDSEAWYSQYRGRWKQAGILFGWCIMAKAKVIEKIGGFDERFKNSHEDNDLCLRAQLAGYKLIIAYDTYIHHLGQGTIRNKYDIEKYKENGFINRERYYDKWYKPGKKKLVAVYRTNGGKYLEKSLEQTSKFANHIIIHFCRFARDINRAEYIGQLSKKFPKITKVEFYDGIFQEDYERNWLLQEALKLNKAGEADWCISIDDDEIYEDKFIEQCQALMNPRNPEIFAYWCHWRTIWETRPDGEYYRTDSTFGRFSNYRFFKLIQGQEIYHVTHPEGHHCGSAPLIAMENTKWTNIRVKHLGYDTSEQRQKKYEFYEKNDNFKRKEDIGYEDYRHLISTKVELQKYCPDHGISCLIMVKNEEEHILECLENIYYLVDEIVVIDTGSTDKTLNKIEYFSKYSRIPVKVFKMPWGDNYSIPRNFGKTKCTKKYILHIDADERFEIGDLDRLFRLSEKGYDAVIFHVVNYLEPITEHKKPKYASTEAIRLFRNIPEFYYSGILHETLDDSFCAYARSHKIKFDRSHVLLHHYGYLRPEKRLKGKLQYYEKLNEKQIEVTEGRDPRPYYNLALHYLNGDDIGKAMQYFQKSLELNPRFWHANQQMAALKFKTAKQFLINALENMPEGHPFIPEGRKIVDFLNEHSFGCQKVI